MKISDTVAKLNESVSPEATPNQRIPMSVHNIAIRPKKMVFVKTSQSIYLTQAESRRHLEIMLISTVAILLATYLEVGANQQMVHVSGITWIPMPRMCYSKVLYGQDCPACGLTRSWIYLAHGHWRESLQMHRLGWLLFLAAALQIPYRFQLLYFTNSRSLSQSFAWLFSRTIVSLIFLNWLLGLLLPKVFDGN